MDTAEAKPKTGILLDVGCGKNKYHETWTGMDKRDLPGVDKVHDLEVFPWPFEDESVLSCLCSHVLEHVKPWLTIDVFNEIWRIMRPGGQLIISVPYGVGAGFQQDPTHCNPFNENTFLYFDPDPPGFKGKNVLYGIYEPKPWLIQHRSWKGGNMEVILVKRTEVPK
jgi:SAM-dependent methyltransferase